MNTIILAIDLGKYKNVVCILDDASGEAASNHEIWAPASPLPLGEGPGVRG